MTTQYRYTGDAGAGEHLHGIPARDLADEDVAALDDERRAALAASALYEPIRPRAKAEVPEKADAPPAGKGEEKP